MIIIGSGRVGGGLKLRADRVGVAATMVSRRDGWAAVRADESGPILVCVNAGDLGNILDSTPTARHDDLVFIQNGMLDTFLSDRRLAANSRGLLYFAVPKRGVEPQPGGPSIFAGLHANAMVAFFQSIELEAQAVSKSEFSNEMATKLIWNCVFGLLCEVLDIPVGQICTDHRAAIDSLVEELVTVANVGIDTSLDAATTSDSLVAYSNSIPNYQGALKQWEWRNGWFVDAAKRLNIVTPTHHKFLVGRRPVGR